MKKNIFVEYDEQLDPPTLPEKRMKDKLILASGWLNKDGDFPGHFRDRSPHSLIWTCNWATSKGVLSPRDWYPIERMRSFELAAEGADLLGQFPDDPVVEKLISLITPYLLDTIRSPGQWLIDIQKVIKNARLLYRDYVCLWDYPAGMIFYHTYRPGWPGKPPPPEQDRTPPTVRGSRDEPPLGQDPDAARRVN